MGVFFFAAAFGFWIFGLLPFWSYNGPLEHPGFHLWPGRIGFSDFEWYHGLNWFFFEMAFAFMILGPVYAVLARGRNAFAREAPFAAGDDDGWLADEAATAPTPYVMLPA
jgi:hypothetical protein